MTFEDAQSFYRGRVVTLLEERRRLSRQGANVSRLEQNRVALARARWQLARAVVESCSIEFRTSGQPGDADASRSHNTPRRRDDRAR